MHAQTSILLSHLWESTVPEDPNLGQQNRLNHFFMYRSAFMLITSRLVRLRMTGMSVEISLPEKLLYP